VASLLIAVFLLSPFAFSAAKMALSAGGGSRLGVVVLALTIGGRTRFLTKTLIGRWPEGSVHCGQRGVAVELDHEPTVRFSVGSASERPPGPRLPVA